MKFNHRNLTIFVVLLFAVLFSYLQENDRLTGYQLLASPDLINDPPIPDADGDGFRAISAGGKDCNDNDEKVNPKAKETCGDNIDTDCDNAVGCGDSDCCGESACSDVLMCIRLRPEICDNKIDDNANKLIDCMESSCRKHSNCVTRRPDVEICTNGKDDDKDGYVDCRDSNCINNPACLEQGLECNNKRDDDGDGKVDCADFDCFGSPNCASQNSDPPGNFPKGPNGPPNLPPKEFSPPIKTISDKDVKLLSISLDKISSNGNKLLTGLKELEKRSNIQLELGPVRLIDLRVVIKELKDLVERVDGIRDSIKNNVYDSGKLQDEVKKLKTELKDIVSDIDKLDLFN